MQPPVQLLCLHPSNTYVYHIYISCSICTIILYTIKFCTKVLYKMNKTVICFYIKSVFVFTDYWANSGSMFHCLLDEPIFVSIFRILITGDFSFSLQHFQDYSMMSSPFPKITSCFIAVTQHVMKLNVGFLYNSHKKRDRLYILNNIFL